MHKRKIHDSINNNESSKDEKVVSLLLYLFGLSCAFAQCRDLEMKINHL